MTVFGARRDCGMTPVTDACALVTRATAAQNAPMSSRPAVDPPHQAVAALDDVERFIVRGSRAFTLANVALFAAGFTTFALIYCVQPIMPVLGQDFEVDAATASLSLSATTQCLAVAMLVASSLSEVYGRKPVMVLSLFASSALMIATAFAPTWPSLLVLRALAGIAFSGLPATAMAYVGEEMDRESVGLAMGLYIGGTGLGALGGRLIVGGFTDLGSWRTGLFVIGVLALLSSVVFVLALPASRHFRPARRAPARSWPGSRATSETRRNSCSTRKDRCCSVSSCRSTTTSDTA